MYLPVIRDVFVRGASGWDSTSYVDSKGRPVKTYDYGTLEQAFNFTSGTATSSYRQLHRGQLLRWFRWTSNSARMQSDITTEVFCMHLEWDLAKNAAGLKCWPGVTEHNGIWTANSSAERLIYEAAAQIKQRLGLNVHWYASRGGIHAIQRIAPLPFDTALGHIAAYLRGRELDFSGLHLDHSSVEPSRLMYLPRILKKDVGILNLPLHIDTLQQEIALPAPLWAAKVAPQLALKALDLAPDELKWARNFARRWLQSHIDWLDNALPGDGRNNRLFAFAADIAQLYKVGLIDDLDYYLKLARLQGENANIRPIHNWEDAIENGLNSGSTGTIAQALLDLQRLATRKNMILDLARGIR